MKSPVLSKVKHDNEEHFCLQILRTKANHMLKTHIFLNEKFAKFILFYFHYTFQLAENVTRQAMHILNYLFLIFPHFTYYLKI